ncbi:hypothetical protein B0T21DRAFT_389336, partial [Apiosordaria backusii]
MGSRTIIFRLLIQYLFKGQPLRQSPASLPCPEALRNSRSLPHWPDEGNSVTTNNTLKNDCENGRIWWRTVMIWTGYFVFLSSLVFTIVTLVLWTKTPSLSVCKRDGSFSPFIMEDMSLFSRSSVFEINIGFGPLSLTGAKSVDVIFDLVVGRGGQALIAYISWRVLRDTIAVSMERRGPVTYNAFWTAFLQPEPSAFSTYKIMMDCSFHRALGNKLAVVFTIMSLVFIIIFPTQASALSGYVGIAEAFIKDYRGNYVKFSEFDFALYILHDGHRVNMTDDLVITATGTIDERRGAPEVFRTTFWPQASPGLSQTHTICGDGQYPYFWTDNNLSELHLQDLKIEDACSLQRRVSYYVFEYGSQGRYNNSTPWYSADGVVTLPAPALNITQFYLFEQRYFPQGRQSTINTSAAEMQLTDPSKIAFTYANEVYNLTYIQQNGKCQPASDMYKWGFSFMQAFVMLVALLVWSLGTWMMWLQANFNLPLQKHSEVPDMWKSILHLSDCMNKEFAAYGLDVTGLSNRQIEDEITRDRLKGGTVAFETSADRLVTPFWECLWTLIKKETWWSLSFTLHMAFALTATWFMLDATFGDWRGEELKLKFLRYSTRFPVLISLAWSTCYAVYLLLIVSKTKWARFLVPLAWILLGV